MPAGIVIQSRMGSARFPGKSLALLGGRPLLAVLLERLAGLSDVVGVYVATSDRPGDDAIEACCDDHGVACLRGSEQDVLGRYAEAARRFDLDPVVRACGDAPLTDPEGVRAVLQAYRDAQARFAHNRHDAGWPVGTAVDVIERDALLLAEKEAREPAEREHVIPWLVARAERFGTVAVEAPAALRRPGLHLAVDVPRDLERLRALWDAFPDGGPPTLRAALEFFDAHPEHAR